MNGHRPADAAAFVATVEHATNHHVIGAARDIFADDAKWVAITDGAREESVGLRAIDTAWAQACATFRARQYRVRKRLVAATDDTIINEWDGGPRGRTSGRGIEVWRFNRDGKVAHLSAYSYLKVRSPFHPLQTVQLLLGSPGMTIAAGLTRLRHRSNRLGRTL